MNKKRGVLLSTTNHPQPKTINKSHSTQNHLPQLEYPRPQPTQNVAQNNHPLTESNLLEEEPQRLVNQAYYTYHDPDALPPHLQYSEKSEDENEEQAIQSMQKRQQELLRQRREEEKVKAAERAERAKNIASRTNKNKQMSMTKFKPSVTTADIKKLTPRTKIKEITILQQKQAKDETGEVKKEKRQINPTLFQPKPLVYSVNMFTKGNLSPRSRKTQEQTFKILTEKIQQRTMRSHREQSHFQQAVVQNLNCKKLPFRFTGVI